MSRSSSLNSSETGEDSASALGLSVNALAPTATFGQSTLLLLDRKFFRASLLMLSAISPVNVDDTHAAWQYNARSVAVSGGKRPPFATDATANTVKSDKQAA